MYYMGMEYLLKHKDLDVAVLELTENGSIKDISSVLVKNHLPFPVVMEDGSVNKKRLEDWWNDRGIPVDRENYKQILNEVNLKSKNEMLKNSMGLSLTDHYWICDSENKKKWKDVNYYENDFDKVIGEIIFGINIKKEKFTLNSPDIGSSGNLIKRWTIRKDGKRVMEKRGCLPFQQEPANEEIASLICEKLNIRHVPYRVDFVDDIPISTCENMTSTEKEFISAIHVYDILMPLAFGVNMYDHYTKCLEKLNIANYRQTLDKMLVLDYIMLNHDRHFNNFGVLRNSDTLDAYEIAPVFDTGTSLFCREINERIVLPERRPLKHSGFDTLEKQLLLVSDWSWYRKNELKDLGRETTRILKKIPTVNRERAEKIGMAIEERLVDLSKWV